MFTPLAVNFPGRAEFPEGFQAQVASGRAVADAGAATIVIPTADATSPRVTTTAFRGLVLCIWFASRLVDKTAHFTQREGRSFG